MRFGNSVAILFLTMILIISLIILIMQGPLYWCVIMYALITMEEDEVKKALRISKRDNFKTKFKNFILTQMVFHRII